MIYITGDVHRDFSRIEAFCQKFQTTKNDILIILGDVGINYYGKEDNELKKYLQQIPITLFCVYGNHEERPENINTYKLVDRFAGKVFQEEDYPNLLFARDGEIYQLNGKSVLVIGGAFSINKEYIMEKGYKWFKDEQPNEKIKERTLENIKKHHFQVDYILSHTCPYRYIPQETFYVGIDQAAVDQSTEKFLDLIEQTTDYQEWFCGHFHTDKTVDKISFMFNGYKSLGE